MELGSWSIIQAPSLLALIPLVVYIVLVFRGKNNVSGIIVGIFLAVLMLGQNLKAVSVGLAASLGSSTALIGMIIMAGAGLGVLMTEAGVSRTMVYWIVKRIGVNTPILIPIMASLGITPSVVASLFKVSGEIGLMVGPLTGVTLITEEVTGLSYGQLMVGAVLPFSAVWLIGMWIAANRTQKRTAGKEYYELSDDIKNFDSIVISAQEKRATIAFLITFVALVGYGIYSKQGTNYALTVMCILAAVVAIFSRMEIDHAVNSMIKGIASQAGMFVVFVTIDYLLNLVTLGGGFTALSNLLGGLAGDNASAVMLIASVVGGFGIEAAAVAEIKIISEMFGASAIATGLPMSMFAISILAATRLTGSMYPTTNLMGQLGIAHCDNTKEVLRANWFAVACVWAFLIIWAFLGVAILK